MDPLSLIDPISTTLSVFFFFASYSGDPDLRYQAKCYGVTQWARCHQENYANIHTPEYMWALKTGQNIRIRRKR